MKKFEGMLFCTDLDGTLYADDKTVSKENLDAIRYFQAEGGLFTFITGRVPVATREICDTIRPNAPFGCINGGGIYDPIKEALIWKRELPEEALELVRCVDAQLPEIGIQCNTEKHIWFNKDNQTMQTFRRITGAPFLTCSYEELPEPLLKVVMGHPEEAQILALKALLDHHPKAGNYDFIRSERELYEILPKGVSKGSVLQKLAELLGIEMRHTIAVGDYNNDIAMLRVAGHSFAVANAVDEVRAVADHVTVSNNEHAIAAIVDGLSRGRFCDVF